MAINKSPKVLRPVEESKIALPSLREEKAVGNWNLSIATIECWTGKGKKLPRLIADNGQQQRVERATKVSTAVAIISGFFSVAKSVSQSPFLGCFLQLIRHGSRSSKREKVAKDNGHVFLLDQSATVSIPECVRSMMVVKLHFGKLKLVDDSVSEQVRDQRSDRG